MARTKCLMEISTGMRSFNFHDFSRIIGSKTIQYKIPELLETSKWNAQFPLGNSIWDFWSTFQSPFPRENFPWERKIFPFTNSLRRSRSPRGCFKPTYIYFSEINQSMCGFHFLANVCACAPHAAASNRHTFLSRK